MNSPARTRVTMGPGGGGGGGGHSGTEGRPHPRYILRGRRGLF